MASGDNMQAAVNLLFCCSISVFAGVKLQVVREKFAEAIKFMGERNQVIFMIQTQLQHRTASKLIGTDDEPRHVSSEEQNIITTNNSVKTS